jgi:hypothetical protein
MLSQCVRQPLLRRDMTGCAQRNRLKPKVFESLQLLKSAYRKGCISATTQAAQRVEDLELLDGGSDDDNDDTDI